LTNKIKKVRINNELAEIQELGSRKENLVGRRFGRLLVTSFGYRIKYGDVYWKCLCDCGTEKIVGHFALTYNRTVSCGCYNKEHCVKISKCDNIVEYQQARKNRNREDILTKPLYSRYKKTASKKDRDFSLTLPEFQRLITSPCFYCGAMPQNKFKVETYFGSMLYNGVDRVDNQKGYILENCVSCCETCNRAKLEMSKDSFYSWITLIYNNLKNKGEFQDDK
jgi:hypothetical protein